MHTRRWRVQNASSTRTRGETKVRGHVRALGGCFAHSHRHNALPRFVVHALTYPGKQRQDPNSDILVSAHLGFGKCPSQRRSLRVSAPPSGRTIDDGGSIAVSHGQWRSPSPNLSTHCAASRTPRQRRTMAYIRSRVRNPRTWCTEAEDHRTQRFNLLSTRSSCTSAPRPISLQKARLLRKKDCYSLYRKRP